MQNKKLRFMQGCFLAGASLSTMMTIAACAARNYEICETDNCSTTNLVVLNDLPPASP